MTSEVTQAALEPCPFCGGKAEWKDDPGICGVPFGLVVDHKPDCFLAFPLSEEAQLSAWNTRLTAQSGEGRSGALLTSGNESRVMNKTLGDCPDCAEGECSMNCSSAIQCTSSEWIAASIWAGVFPQRASAKQVGEYLTAQSGEDRSGAGEDALEIRALKAAKQFIENGIEMGFIRMPDASTPDSAHETLPLIRAALNARQSGEGERE